MKKDRKTFNQLFRSFLEDGALLVDYTHSTLKNYQLVKHAAWRMAKYWVEMLSHFQDQLLAQVKSEGKTIDEFMQAWFAPFEAVEGDVGALITAVSDGMTCKEYLATTAAIFMGKKRKKMPSASSRPLPPPPSESETLEDKAARWETRARAAEQKLAAVERELARCKRDLKKLLSMVG